LMMASGTRLRRFAYYGAVVVGTAAALGFTSAHNSSSANPFSRDRRSSGEISAITERMASTGWRVPNRNTQESALRGSSEVSPFDVLVIGGGATGCGVALDAATRGLRVGLVERDDFSAGTSSRSTKLVHGGVRYLEKAFWHFDYGQLKLVFHALEERARILHNAPHLCNALPTMTPCYEWYTNCSSHLVDCLLEGTRKAVFIFLTSVGHRTFHMFFSKLCSIRSLLDVDKYIQFDIYKLRA
jgi:glycerol-3-phosphate dehydrogenase